MDGDGDGERWSEDFLSERQASRWVLVQETGGNGGDNERYGIRDGDAGGRVSDAWGEDDGQYGHYRAILARVVQEWGVGGPGIPCFKAGRKRTSDRAEGREQNDLTIGSLISCRGPHTPFLVRRSQGCV